MMMMPRSTPLQGQILRRQWQEGRTIILNASPVLFSRASFSSDSQRSSRLSSTEQHQLSDEFSLEKLSAKDERMINHLIAYKEIHGDCHVPTSKRKFIEEERQRLGISDELVEWVSQKRRQYMSWQTGKVKNKNIPESDQVQILILESMGFMWSEREAQWQRYFNRLEAHKARHGTLHVAKEKDPQLWLWADMQRKTYQKEKMPEARVNLLEEIGFAFDLQEAAWRQSYEKLADYAKEHGTANFPTQSEEDPSLGGWVARQRRHYHMNELSEERIRELESIGFSWDIHGEKWEEFYNELVTFHSDHGHTRVPVTAGPLWAWVDRQRRILRQQASDEDGFSAESNDKIAALNRINFDWSIAKDDEEGRTKRLMELMFSVAVQDERWVENYKKLCAFKERFGHFSIPPNRPEYRELSTWMKRQRFLYKRDRLPEERIAALDEIGFAWTGQAARWDILYEQLVRFQAEHGHTRVPTKSRELYRWTNQQRKALRDLAEKNQTKAPGARAESKPDPRLLALGKILADD